MKMYSNNFIKSVSSDIPHLNVFIFLRAILQIVTIVSHFCFCRSDIFVGDHLDPFFTSRPNPIQNYDQWGHYPILYQNPNRPLEPINRHDPRYSAVTPDNFNRYKIEDPGDLRCPEAVREGEKYNRKNSNLFNCYYQACWSLQLLPQPMERLKVEWFTCAMNLVLLNMSDLDQLNTIL